MCIWQDPEEAHAEAAEAAALAEAVAVASEEAAAEASAVEADSTVDRDLRIITIITDGAGDGTVRITVITVAAAALAVCSA